MKAIDTDDGICEELKTKLQNTFNLELPKLPDWKTQT